MKIVVAGSTGFVATEIIRQALSHSDITTVVALGRREISAPPNLGPTADPSKLKSVILQDFENYTKDVKEELTGLDAVIWTIAIVPSKLKTISWEQACKISRDYAIKGIETISQLPREGKTKPLRFIYMSGSHAERNQSKKPLILGDYRLMRRSALLLRTPAKLSIASVQGDAESRILAYAQQFNGAVEACVARSGVIEDPEETAILAKVGRMVIWILVNLPKVAVSVISAALLDQVVKGFEKDTLLNEDLVRIGQKALAGQK
ncbi:uncharacterized protein Z518_08497 [Rhinocladiella mackenziei CBS 650.93]|uniref:NAD(P)-binding domain-containing protein n=1 Tax=Rhinocladiella mackenziei CBS 650.93 TaxID=1442369 RepID=A0A0D2IGZ2_9EURO|nr:uncharacterized protein Z518_08497 [Rhinocladiella mackenziei CBS 650.93]KIX02556.1 hypothetical protein Z518_08497 [Rhinocladiella mackenziei CBS 650.93]